MDDRAPSQAAPWIEEYLSSKFVTLSEDVLHVQLLVLNTHKKPVSDVLDMGRRKRVRQVCARVEEGEKLVSATGPQHAGTPVAEQP
ncbi:hypothetical protein E2C01_039944 [Portunus trituberculatus]|uniref:Uncharacterized protein n=1 Tax=Portunus trituberculatus TaxID=210409 RepID=A0A5B7FF42_PORTR|nr:hypothetical protein [Portunus trituberculatus]